MNLRTQKKIFCSEREREGERERETDRQRGERPADRQRQRETSIRPPMVLGIFYEDLVSRLKMKSAILHFTSRVYARTIKVGVLIATKQKHHRFAYAMCAK